MTENNPSPNPHSLGVTKTNLVPTSLPEENQTVVVTVNMCSFGLRLTDNRHAFIKFFKQRMAEKEEEWGEIEERIYGGIVEDRGKILVQLANDFFKQIQPKSNMPELELARPPTPPPPGKKENKYIASYGYRNHDVLFDPRTSIGTPFSQVNFAELARVLYHEMRHPEQVILITRFMLARGQDPILKKINPIIIRAAKAADKSDTVQAGTDGKIISSHRHYHCAVRLYASLFGVPEEEQTLTPNVYDNKPYTVPVQYNQQVRDANEIIMTEEDAKIIAEYKQVEAATIPKWMADVAKMREQNIEQSVINADFEQRAADLLKTFEGRQKAVQQKYYVEALLEEKEAHEVSDIILEEYHKI